MGDKKAALRSGKPARIGRNRRNNPVQEQRFSSYIHFGLQSTACLACFLLFYVLVLASLQPLLTEPPPPPGMMAAGASLHGAHIPGQEKIEQMASVVSAHVPGKDKMEEVASAVKRQVQALRKGKGVTDESLMKAAAQEFSLLRKKAMEQKIIPKAVKNILGGNTGARTGFVVLGMHRSGTSMLSGLLVSGNGYNVGGPLIGAHFDNEKGFFERIDVVLQNDAFMAAQQIWWAANVINYDPEQALKDKEAGKVEFKEGEKGLAFLNNPKNAPWLQKDPRMSITLKTWLHLLNSEPAAVFTYRHPMEVAMSLNKREKNFPIEKGLRLWIVYNMRAIQNSAGLCRVLSSNEAILAEPLNEVQRISDDLTSKCGVPSPPRRITQEDVEKFIDPSLQHNKKQRELEAEKMPVLEDYNGCIIRDYESKATEGTPERTREARLYRMAMKIFCDFKSGDAYKDNYTWPNLKLA